MSTLNDSSLNLFDAHRRNAIGAIVDEAAFNERYFSLHLDEQLSLEYTLKLQMFCVGGAPCFLTCPVCLKSHNFYTMKLAQSFRCFTSLHVFTNTRSMHARASLTGLQSHILTSRPPRDCEPVKIYRQMHAARVQGLSVLVVSVCHSSATLALQASQTSGMG